MRKKKRPAKVITQPQDILLSMGIPSPSEFAILRRGLRFECINALVKGKYPYATWNTLTEPIDLHENIRILINDRGVLIEDTVCMNPSYSMEEIIKNSCKFASEIKKEDEKKENKPENIVKKWLDEQFATFDAALQKAIMQKEKFFFFNVSDEIAKDEEKLEILTTILVDRGYAGIEYVAEESRYKIAVPNVMPI